MSNNTQEIIEGNRLIAEFMEKEVAFEATKPNGTKVTFYLTPSAIDDWSKVKVYYHTSWDWLIPVAKKFDNLTETIPSNVYWEYEQCCDGLDNAVTSYEIQRAWVKLVKVIEWYNLKTSSK